MQFKFTRPFLLVLSFIISTFIFLSCQKEITDDPFNPSLDLPITIEGIVTGANGIPLQGVSVKAGNVQVTTDANGSFRTTDARFSTNETFVTATKPGYFTGSRTFYARENSNNFIRIQMLPRTETAAINASSGGVATVGGATVTFPANAFANPDGSPYSGTASIKAAYLDPTNPSIQQQMPGDLRGVRTTGEMRGLKSYGMMNVEMEGAAGQKLQLRAGVTAQLSMPIPASLMSTSLSTIPMWHFDETSGLWKEEGTAQKSGNRYTGSVSHFTFWNVDVPFQFVKLDMKVVNQAQQGIQGALVELTSVADSSVAYDYTDNNGFVDGYVPINVQLRRDIYNECNTLVSSTLIGPFSANTDLGNVSITSAATNQKTISGTVTNCAGLPLAGGYVIISMQGNTVYANVTAGAYSRTFTSCDSIGGIATVIAVDTAAQQQSNPVIVALNTSAVVVPVIQACGNTSDEFITISVDGVSRTWSVAPYELHGIQDTLTSGYYDLYIAANDSSASGGGAITILLNRSVDSITVPFHAGIQEFGLWDPLAAPSMLGDYFVDNTATPTPQAAITQFGPSGQFIVGSFTGRFIKNTQTSVDTVTVNASFKVRRE